MVKAKHVYSEQDRLEKNCNTVRVFVGMKLNTSYIFDHTNILLRSSKVQVLRSRQGRKRRKAGASSLSPRYFKNGQYPILGDRLCFPSDVD
jgi:hypothetical protein